MSNHPRRLQERTVALLGMLSIGAAAVSHVTRPAAVRRLAGTDGSWYQTEVAIFDVGHVYALALSLRRRPHAGDHLRSLALTCLLLSVAHGIALAQHDGDARFRWTALTADACYAVMAWLTASRSA